MNNKDITDFLTIEKREYNNHLSKMVDKKFYFFSIKEKAFKSVKGYKRRDYDNDIFFFPPTIDYTFNKLWTNNLQVINKTLWLKIKPTTKKDKIKFSENIRIQEEVLRIVKKRNETFNYRCWLIKLTTWKWKSHIIIDIANYYQTNTLILVHNVKTLSEMVEKFETFTNIKPSQYWWWKKEIWNIAIMTKKIFSLDQEKISNDFNLILIDEAPVQFSKNFWNALNFVFDWKKWIALYWLSWTPQKIELNQDDLQKYFWEIIEVKNQARNWYNIIPDFTMYDYTVDSWKYEYENPAEMRWEISENMERLKEQIIRIKELFENRKCLLILTDRKLEVENFFKHKDFGFTFCMTGDTSIEEDNQNIESAKKLIQAWKKVCIIWTIQKVGIGIDIPFIDTIFLASAIKFSSTVIQSIGRWLRLYVWKNNTSVWIWNDLPHYKWQKSEKLKVIKSEYLKKNEDINIIKIIRKRKKVI